MASMVTALETAAAVLPTGHSWIGGREVTGEAGTRPSVNPATGEAFAQASLLTAAQAAEAVAAARAAFPAWSRRPVSERARFLLAARDVVLREAEAIETLIQREQGKPAAEAHLVEVFPALAILAHLAEQAEDVLRDEPVEPEVLLFAHKDCSVRYEPFGVVLAITPWNYPFGISMSGVAAALAAGNTVVLKPAPATTQVGLKLGQVFARAGLPPGVLSVVVVDDAVAQSLVEDPRLGKILFTGSTATGRKVMAAAARNPTPVLLELGGKDPAIVCADADLDRAARGVVWGAFMNAGQTCASVERVYVQREVAEAFTARVVEQARALRVGDPGRGECDVGPLTMERQRLVVEEQVADALARGARAVTGGRRPEGPGLFYPPTVLVGVDHSMRVMREETFGPLLPIMAVDSLDEAIRLANESDYGLTASGWTRSPETARRLQAELQAGVVTINDHVSSYGEPTGPWGGYKRSGIGRTHGRAGLREMVQVKYVTRDTSRKPFVWWYPYDASFLRLIRVHSRAFYSSFPGRLANQLRIPTFARFWRRVHPLNVVKRLDRLF
jgi:succinate-semialdehyde dehydrogenase/glutarate-semialdehyde dehydrogenase